MAYGMRRITTQKKVNQDNKNHQGISFSPSKQHIKPSPYLHLSRKKLTDCAAKSVVMVNRLKLTPIAMQDS